MKLIQLVYVSSATVPFSASDLVVLLDKSRTNNAKLNVSGLLLFKEGNFMQVLEGAEEDVMPLYSTISKDHRHAGILMLLKGPLAKRDFADWSMAFRDLKDVDLLVNPGYSEFLNVPLTDHSLVEDVSKAKRLLSIFRTSMR